MAAMWKNSFERVPANAKRAELGEALPACLSANIAFSHLSCKAPCALHVLEGILRPSAMVASGGTGLGYRHGVLLES